MSNGDKTNSGSAKSSDSTRIVFQLLGETTIQEGIFGDLLNYQKQLVTYFCKQTT